MKIIKRTPQDIVEQEKKIAIKEHEKELVYLNHTTGEITPFRGIARSEKQLAGYRNKELRVKTEKSNNFIWVLFNYGEELFPTLSPTNISRLFYLATYCDYNGRLSYGLRKDPLTKNQIKEKLNLSRNIFANFWKEMIDNQILLEKENNEIFINTEYFNKGNIENISEGYTRLYCEQIQNIYESCADNRNHKHLSYIFKIIPYVNPYANIVSWNPLETNQQLIAPMTIGDFCDKIHYERKKAKRLFQDLLKIQVNGQRLLGFFVPDWDITKWYIVINPRIYYSGNYKKEIECLFNNQAKFSLPERK